MASSITAFICLCLLACSVCSEDPYAEVIEEISRDKLDQLVDDTEYVAVVFFTKNCKACEDALAELEFIDDDVSKYGVKMVKINNIEEAREHGVESFPAMIYWRKEVPILYEGKWDDKEILYWIIHNKHSDVQILHDGNFEKITEAASGMGTGDWFVLFYESSDKKCIQMIPRWEAVGSRLNHKMTMAKVDVESNENLDKRFGIDSVPQAILFRQGKMYRYNQETYDTTSLVSFASRWYKSSKPERIPKLTAAEDAADQLAADIQTKNLLLSIAAATVALVVAASLMIAIFVGLGYLKVNRELEAHMAEVQKRQ